MPENTSPRSSNDRRLIPHHYSRAIPLLVGVLMLILVGCRPPTPPPTSAPTAPPVPEPTTSLLLPTVTPSPAATDDDDEAVLPEPLAGLANRLSSSWRVETLTGEELAAIAGETAIDSGTFIARYTAGSGDPGAPLFTVLLTPRTELSLQAYLDDVAALLAATGGVEAGGVTVNEARIDSIVRQDGIPAALIRFQADGKLFDAEGIVVEGVQVAVLDEPAANIMVITLTSDSARADQLQPLLEEIVAILVQPDATE